MDEDHLSHIRKALNGRICYLRAHFDQTRKSRVKLMKRWKRLEVKILRVAEIYRQLLDQNEHLELFNNPLGDHQEEIKKVNRLISVLKDTGTVTDAKPSNKPK